jgi:hypothetical protein
MVPTFVCTKGQIRSEQSIPAQSEYPAGCVRLLVRVGRPTGSWTPRCNSVHWRSRGPTLGSSTGRLMIGVLGGLADVERDLIRARTAEGRSRAQNRGQHMGRRSKLTAAQKAEARRRAQGATLAELARSYHVGKSTISRLTG